MIMGWSWTVGKEGFGVAFIIALPHPDYPHVQNIFCMEAPPNTWAQCADPGNLEKGPNKIPGTAIVGPDSRLPLITRSNHLSFHLLLPSPHPQSRLAFLSIPLHLVQTCKQTICKRSTHDSRAFSERFPITRVRFVSIHRRIASALTRIHNKPLCFRQTWLRMCPRNSRPSSPSKLPASLSRPPLSRRQCCNMNLTSDAGTAFELSTVQQTWPMSLIVVKQPRPLFAPMHRSGYGQDSVDIVFSCWSDVARYLQSRFQSSLLHSNPMAGLSGYGYSDSLSFDQHLQADHFDFSSGFLQAEGSSQPSADTLSSLNEFSFLATVHNPTPSPTLASASNGTNLYADPAWPWGQSESPDMGVLQLALQTLDTSESPANDVPSFNFGNTSLTVNLASISPPPVGVFDLSQEEDTTATASSCGTSLGFSTPASDGAISPASFSFSPSARQQQNPLELSTDAAGPFSFRRHSIGATSAPPPREVGMKTKRDGDDDDDHRYAFNYVDGSFFPAAADAHTSKRMRADGGAIVKATSAPARFTVPLPNVEKNDCDDDDDGGVSGPGQSLAPFTPATASTSTAPLPSPVPASTSAPAPAPAPRRARRRAGTGAGGSGGRAARARRTKCEFCPRTFSRAQDAQRHAVASCAENPDKAGVRCPECGEVLSRLDSAQRHWRGHENPQCETPKWAH
ncbi:hypothetical protein EDB92DRAFT_1230348 [Lactarius akahatsu]|uniref:C2H2-type domain-containing protein n=1 Tax=Lactarius akahatsu TaxID=416441 RepID=A0AAD4LCW2_9AGAM|nr:hypothetical protein EDB92DRAFT_1230348 [Lactarius akahatsu]